MNSSSFITERGRGQDVSTLTGHLSNLLGGKNAAAERVAKVLLIAQQAANSKCIGSDAMALDLLTK